MNNFRTVREARINFLFFQDIITCVMGILILVTLMLTLSVNTGEAATAEEQQLETQLSSVKQQLAETEQQNRSTEQQALRLTSLPDRPALETELMVLQREVEQSVEQLLQAQKKAVAAKTLQERALLDRQNAAPLQQTVSNLETQLAAARDQLAAFRRQTNAVYIVPTAEARDSAQQPVAFIVSDNKVEIRRFNDNASQERTISSADDLRPLLANLNPARDYVVFYFRPSGAKWFEPFRALVRSLGFAVGYDAIEEQKQIIFSNQ